MPRTFTDEGLAAAQEIRVAHPDVGVLVLSQYVDVAYAMKLVSEESQRVGYLLKDRIADVPELAAALQRIANGGSVVDPSLVAELVAAPATEDPLAELTAREREVLALPAEGRTDRGIAQLLYITPKRSRRTCAALSADSTCPPTRPRTVAYTPSSPSDGRELTLQHVQTSTSNLAPRAGRTRLARRASLPNETARRTTGGRPTLGACRPVPAASRRTGRVLASATRAARR
jgi:hypothetical protein